jgi:hypothetical protein
MQKLSVPAGLTTEQFDIVNLNGEAKQQKNQYKLEDDILREFGQDQLPPAKASIVPR